MKRAASPASTSAKRPRLSEPHPLLLDDIAEQDPEDLLQNGVDEDKCIAGTLRTVRPFPQRKIEVVASIGHTADKHAIKLRFELHEKYLSILDLAPLDRFRISLRGAVLQNVANIPPHCTLPFFLVFSGGLHITWTHQGSDSNPKCLNTWTISGKDQVDVNPWYYTQDRGSVIPHTSNVGESKAVAEVPQAATHSDLKSVRASKRQQKVEAKRQKREALQQADSKTNISAHPSPANTGIPPPEDSSAQSGDISKPPDKKPGPETTLFKPGFRSGPDIYIPIGDVRTRFKQYVHLAGIVTDISEPRLTRSGELSRHIQVVDPSIYGEHDAYGIPRGFKITCFTRTHKEWLPSPKLGEVVLFRDVKVSDFNGNINGVGYHNKLRWAAYSPLERVIHHGQLNQAPRAEGLGPEATGVSFSPFLDPGAVELDYCAKLFEWWQGVTGNSGKDAPASSQVGNRSPRSIQRQHRLISEAGPNVEPGGYFDCTIEILRVWVDADSRYVTVYATDYTRQEGMMGGASHQLPASLSDYVLKFEMWEAAAAIAKNMKSGQYYLINNARMRLQPSGSLEVKVVQNKITLLKEADADRNNHLKGLLERKRAWAAKESKLEEEIRFETFQNVKEGKFFNCTVELLYASNKPNEAPFIYVTDYTAHPSLLALNEPWAVGLEQSIAKIALSDEQKHIAESPVIGGFYSIRKLRLKHSVADKNFRGFLGGHEKLVVLLNTARTDNEHLNGLLRRKEQWTRNRTLYAKESEPRLISDKRRNGPFTRIKDMPLSNLEVGRYQFIARIVDYWPRQLHDGFYQRCTLCKAEIPDSRKACFSCVDFVREHVQFVYQMYILAQDEDGYQIMVSINDDCPILAGLRRAHLRDDGTALAELRERIGPMVGDLEAMHEELESGKTVRYNADGPLFSLDIETWVIAPENKRAFSLVNYRKL